MFKKPKSWYCFVDIANIFLIFGSRSNIFFSECSQNDEESESVIKIDIALQISKLLASKAGNSNFTIYILGHKKSTEGRIQNFICSKDVLPLGLHILTHIVYTMCLHLWVKNAKNHIFDIFLTYVLGQYCILKIQSSAKNFLA